MLAALVEVQAEGEVERHFGRGWKRCAKRRRLLIGSAHQSSLATHGIALAKTKSGKTIEKNGVCSPINSMTSPSCTLQ